jgi:hypothetical protein
MGGREKNPQLMEAGQKRDAQPGRGGKKRMTAMAILFSVR